MERVTYNRDKESVNLKGYPYLEKTKNIKPSKNGMEKQKVIQLILLSICSVLSNYGQKEVT